MPAATGFGPIPASHCHVKPISVGQSANALTTALLKSMRVQRVISRAGSDFNDHGLTPVTRFAVEAARDAFLDVKGRQRVFPGAKDRKHFKDTRHLIDNAPLFGH
jgi:hypothetical protein